MSSPPGHELDTPHLLGLLDAHLMRQRAEEKQRERRHGAQLPQEEARRLHLRDEGVEAIRRPVGAAVREHRRRVDPCLRVAERDLLVRGVPCALGARACCTRNVRVESGADDCAQQRAVVANLGRRRSGCAQETRAAQLAEELLPHPPELAHRLCHHKVLLTPTALRAAASAARELPRRICCTRGERVRSVRAEGIALHSRGLCPPSFGRVEDASTAERRGRGKHRPGAAEGTRKDEHLTDPWVERE